MLMAANDPQITAQSEFNSGQSTQGIGDTRIATSVGQWGTRPQDTMDRQNNEKNLTIIGNKSKWLNFGLRSGGAN